MKNTSMWGVLTPVIAFWVFKNPGGLPSPIFGSVSGDLTLPSKWGCDMKDVFVCDLIVAIKVFQSDIYKMYCDKTSKFTLDNFWAFKSMLEFEHENI